ncbi:MAG: ABC transporter ATP-binding protein [Gammaproteobacteria bacterium]
MKKENDQVPVTPLISLSHVDRSFRVGDELIHGLDDVSLKVQAGEYISIMGSSGSGKSTLLNVLGLLDKPDSGEYLFQGKNILQLSEPELARYRREKIGFVFQSFHLVPRLSAAENIALPLVLAGVNPSDRNKRVEQALKNFHLTDRSQHRPDQLSGGQRQRVAIARATITEPLLLLADEPTGNLDYHSSLEVVEVLEELNRQGISLMVVTHDEELGKRASRTVHMLDGKIRDQS